MSVVDVVRDNKIALPTTDFGVCPECRSVERTAIGVKIEERSIGTLDAVEKVGNERY